MMKSTILRNFYNGEEPPVESGFTQLKYYKKDELWVFLKDELGKKLEGDPEGAGYLEKYEEMVMDIVAMYREEAFLQGFRTGSRMMAEVYGGEE